MKIGLVDPEIAGLQEIDKEKEKNNASRAFIYLENRS